LQIFISIVVTLLVLTALIVVHEFGHYIVAKKRGISVSEFAIGFGPRLVKWHRKETEFSIRPIFAGGFVRFADDMEKEPQPGDFRSASIKSRALTIIAGPLMNVILAVILVTILLMSAGDYQPVVVEISEGTPAAEAGLMPGDVIKKWNGVNIDFIYDMQDVARAEKGAASEITVERDGQKYSYELPYQDVDGQKLVGLSYAMAPKTFNFFEAVGLSFKWIFLQMREIVTTLGKLLFMGEGVENVSGIVGTASIVGEVAMNYGYDMMLTLVALISVNLAIINLLPIPALDGGKLVLYAVEGVRKKPAPERLEGILNLAGFVFLIGLSVFMVFQDIGKMIP